MSKNEEPTESGYTLDTANGPVEDRRDESDPVKSLADEIFSDPEIQRLYRYTATSSAYTSAKIFAPDQAPMIKAYQEALRQADKSDVFALAEGAIDPSDVEIGTPLETEIVRKYAEFEYSERNTQESRDHDLNLEDAKTSGSMSVEVLKALLYIAGTLILTLLGFKVFG